MNDNGPRDRGAAHQNLLRCLDTWKSVTEKLCEAVRERNLETITHLLELREEVLCLIQNLAPVVDTREIDSVVNELRDMEKEVGNLLAGVVAETGDQLERARRAMSLTTSLQGLDGGTRQGRLLDNYR